MCLIAVGMTHWPSGANVKFKKSRMLGDNFLRSAGLRLSMVAVSGVLFPMSSYL